MSGTIVRGPVGVGAFMCLSFVAGPAAGQAAPDPVAAVPAPSPAAAPATVTVDPATGARLYPAAWFAAFAPASALDAVKRLPGFSIEQVDGSTRGFAQAAGNVVINGQRPSAKSDTIETILARIPASRVVRIEVSGGDRFGAEYVGKAQVANVVLLPGGGVATTLEGSLRRNYAGRLYPEGSASMLAKRGKSTFNLALKVSNNNVDEEGYDRLVALPSGQEVEYRRKVNRIAEPTGALSGSWSWDDGANSSAHLNGRASTDRFRLDQANHVTPAGGAAHDDSLSEHYRTDSYELGGDVTRPFAGGGLKLVGLATRRYRDNSDLSLVDLSDPGGFTQHLRDRYDETVGRVSWTRSDWNGWSVEMGAEAALNRLTSRVDLFALDAGGGRTRIDLPIADAVVREVRTESYVSVGRSLSPALRVDAGLNGETSRLTVSGDASASRRLNYLKPRLSLDWRPDGKWHVQASLRRTVAQLQFEDFMSSAELSTDRVNGGNAQLVPQRAWEWRASIERPVLGDGLFRVETGYNRIEQVQDRVPTPEGYDAPGNLGNGSTWILRTRLEAPLKRIGIKGGRLTLYGSLVPTSVRDPYTGLDRPFSYNSLFYGTAAFRQDLGKFAWGFNLEQGTTATGYRRDELDRQVQPLYAEAFAEWRPDRSTMLTFTVENLFDTAGARERLFFTPDRTARDPDAYEFRTRNRHLIPMLTFKRTFG